MKNENIKSLFYDSLIIYFHDKVITRNKLASIKMKLLQRIWNRLNEELKIQGKLYPEFKWRVTVDNKQLCSTDWNGNQRIIDLKEIVRFYVRTTDEGPYVCDV